LRFGEREREREWRAVNDWDEAYCGTLSYDDVYNAFPAVLQFLIMAMPLVVIMDIDYQ